MEIIEVAATIDHEVVELRTKEMINPVITAPSCMATIAITTYPLDDLEPLVYCHLYPSNSHYL
jgi:hypothetical protein